MTILRAVLGIKSILVQREMFPWGGYGGARLLLRTKANVLRAELLEIGSREALAKVSIWVRLVEVPVRCLRLHPIGV